MQRNDDDWSMILNAADGRPEGLGRVFWGASNDCAALISLALLRSQPHPAAALVAAAKMVRSPGALLFHAALAPHVAPALAAWRADPQWVARAVGADVGRDLARGVAVMSGALRDRPAALRDAVAIVLRDGDGAAIDRCLAALGADGWRALEDDLRRALLTRAPAAALGRVWAALDEAPRAAAAQAVKTAAGAAAFIERIGAAWHAVDPTLRKRLIDAVARTPNRVVKTAPAWPSMTEDERETLATATVARSSARRVLRLLAALGAAGRATLTAAQRAALETRAMDPPHAWRVLALRAADGGWDALTGDERRAVLAAANQSANRAAALLRIVGAAAWFAMSADEQSRLAAVIRRTPIMVFACPPALWHALGEDDAPPASPVLWEAWEEWRAEDADADLRRQPAAHRAIVLALAPWRRTDAAAGAVRPQRLRAAWSEMTPDKRVVAATEHPFVPSAVAAAARLVGGAADAADTVGETVARVAAATGGAITATRVVGDLLASFDGWRDWMNDFAPAAADPPEAAEGWRAAAQRGFVPDPAICARLAPLRRAIV